MAGNWEVVKGAVERTIVENDLKVTQTQMKAIKAFVNYNIKVDDAAAFAEDMDLDTSAVEVFRDIMDIIANGKSSKEKENGDSFRALWDAVAKVLYTMQPNDESDYIVTKRR